MRTGAAALVLVLLSSSLSGCFFWVDDAPSVSEEVGPFVFDEAIPTTTWYHYPGTVTEPWAVDATNPLMVSAANITANLTGPNTPIFTNATYYGTGWDTFEPTIGVTSSGAIFFTKYNGL